MPDYSSFPVSDGVRTYLEAPKGYGVNFDNPQTQFHAALYAVFSIGNLLALLFLSQQLYTKLVLSKGLQIEDGFLISSWIFSLVTQGVTIWSVAINARGVHGWEQPIERYALFKISVYISGATFMPCASLAKVALLIFYLRMSPQKLFRYTIFATLGIIACYTPAISLALLFACQPVQASWMLDVEGQCIDSMALSIATCVANIFTTLVLLILPIPMIWGLKMPRAPKIGVFGLFSVGVMTIITSVVRAAILPLIAGPDQSWVTAQASIWSQLECNLLVICGTIPTLKNFTRHVSSRLLGTTGLSEVASTQKFARSTPRSHGYARQSPYAQFGHMDPDLEMTRWDGTAQPPTAAGGTSTTVIRGGPRPASEDQNSDKAIIETTKITIERS